MSTDASTRPECGAGSIGAGAKGPNRVPHPSSGVGASGQDVRMSHFLDLHVPGSPLLMPNPWDAGSARILQSLGFRALATTSAGFANTLRRPDRAVTR